MRPSMEPRIQYVKTPDGVNIAYYTAGEGPVVLFVGAVYSHLLEERKIAWTRSVYDRVSSVATLVRYDPRGFGLSDRDVTAFPLEAMVSDVEAVIDHLDLRDVRVIDDAYGFPAPIAIALAARRPDLISHLLLPAAFVSAPPLLADQVDALLRAPGSDWRFISESISRIAQGWDDPEASSAMASLLRQAIELDGFRRFWNDATKWTAAPFMSHVTARTMVVSYKDHPFFGEAEGRKIVASIPNAQLSVVDSPTAAGRGLQMLAIGASFLGGELPPVAAQSAPSMNSGTAIILFADIVDSTRLTERLGDSAFRDHARQLDESMRAAINQSNGTAIEGKLLGDGVLAVFTAARDAITAALACRDAARSLGLELHLGLHAGDVIREANNVYGGAVNIAARIAATAAPGELLVSQTVRDLARTSAGVAFEDRGEQSLKGIDEPVRVFAIGAIA